jgi:hypothetical protein
MAMQLVMGPLRHLAQNPSVLSSGSQQGNAGSCLCSAMQSCVLCHQHWLFLFTVLHNSPPLGHRRLQSQADPCDALSA